MSERGETRSRGAGFPVLSLNEAVEAVVEAGSYGFEHSREAMAAYLGHETSNSGPFKRKLAALKDWGLVETEGDRISLTDLGRRLAMPTGDDSGALTEAFQRADIFARVYEMSAKGRALDPRVIGNTAALNLGVNPKSKERFARSFIDSAVAAGLAERDGNHVVLISRGRESSPPDSIESPAVLSAMPAASSLQAAHVLRQQWEHSSGYIRFEVASTSPLPLGAYPALQKLVEAVEGLAHALERDGGPENNPKDVREE